MVDEVVHIAADLDVSGNRGHDIGRHVHLPHIEVIADGAPRQDILEEVIRAELIPGCARDPCEVGTVVAQLRSFSPGTVEGAVPIDQ